MFVGHAALRHFKDQVVRAVKFLRPLNASYQIFGVADQDQVASIKILIGNPGKDLGYPALVRRKRL